MAPAPVKSSKTTSPAMRRALARNLRAQLRSLKWSENELARRSGVSQKHINNATNERKTSSIEIVDALANSLKIPAWMLLVHGFEDISGAAALQLSEIVAVFLGADDEGRARLAAAARKIA